MVIIPFDEEFRGKEKVRQDRRNGPADCEDDAEESDSEESFAYTPRAFAGDEGINHCARMEEKNER